METSASFEARSAPLPYPTVEINRPNCLIIEGLRRIHVQADLDLGRAGCRSSGLILTIRPSGFCPSSRTIRELSRVAVRIEKPTLATATDRAFLANGQFADAPTVASGRRASYSLCESRIPIWYTVRTMAVRRGCE